MNTYDQIDAIIESKGISRRQLAIQAGININTMASLFQPQRKNKPMPDKYLSRIANALGVLPETLIDDGSTDQFNPHKFAITTICSMQTLTDNQIEIIIQCAEFVRRIRTSDKNMS